MSANTLRKMAYGDRKNPRLATIEPLLEYFRANPDQARELRPSDPAVEVGYAG